MAEWFFRKKSKVQIKHDLGQGGLFSLKCLEYENPLQFHDFGEVLNG